MNLKQMTYIREIARQSLNISRAAEALNTSQPGVSRQIQMLEEELGVSILRRRKNRTLGFTDFGDEVLRSSTRVLAEIEGIREMAAEARRAGERLTVVTTHMHARYSLLDPVSRYLQSFPEVHLELTTTEPAEVGRIVAGGDADLGLSTEQDFDAPGLIRVPGPAMRRVLIMPQGHPLQALPDLTLAAICDYPMVTYSPGSATGRLINAALRAKGRKPRVVISASDIDVAEAYVEKGLAVAILPGIVVGGADRGADGRADGGADGGFASRDVSDLFPASRITLSLNRETYIKRCVLRFFDFLDGFSRAAVEKTVREERSRERG